MVGRCRSRLTELPLFFFWFWFDLVIDLVICFGGCSTSDVHGTSLEGSVLVLR